MNLNKKVEVFAGLSMIEFIILIVCVFINLVLAYVVYLLFKQVTIAVIAFLFFTANAFLLLQLKQKLPDRFFIHLWEYIKKPKIYLP